MSRPDPKFRIGEVAVLQPPHPSARSYWGAETTVLEIFWAHNVEDAVHGMHSGWSYRTDIPAPPPTDLPEDQHDGWVWAEYDLKKKHEPGQGFSELTEALKDIKITE
ncbi:MAG: hypothetical protein R3208_14415 [Ketobacteraceae bacterium]|nr:hypothetical protein [Ketobacteraceae bacterium]